MEDHMLASAVWPNVDSVHTQAANEQAVFQDKEKRGTRHTGSFACKRCGVHITDQSATALTQMRCAPFLG